MRAIALFLVILFVYGCSFVVTEDNDIKKNYGIRKGDASNLIRSIDEQRPGEAKRTPELQLEETQEEEVSPMK